MTDMNTMICAALRTYMADRGITQTAVAIKLGRTKDYVSGRIRGKYPLSVDIIGGVADLSHLSPRALLMELTERTGQQIQTQEQGSQSQSQNSGG